MKVGVIVRLNENVEAEIKKVHDFGMKTCQFTCWDMTMYTPEMAERVKKACKEYDITVSACWCGYSGLKVWDNISGPITLGLLPDAYRSQRMEDLKRGSDFAAMIGCSQIITHVGFIPENPNEYGYNGMILALRDIAQYAQKNGQYFLFETGQETPVTLLRAIEDIGCENIGVNLDPANLILYGRGNPIDALYVLGKYVRDVHGKDGKYTTDGHKMGEETPLGQGHVDYPRFIKRLKELGYDGPITIEREITGDKQIEDIKMAKELLEKLIAEV